MATTTAATAPINQNIINGMYRLKVKRSKENAPSFQNEFLGNKSLIRKYRQRRSGQKRHFSKEEGDEVEVDSDYEVLESKEDERRGAKEEDHVQPSAPASTLSRHHISRSQRRSNKSHRHHHHRQANYDSPCRLVTMLVI